MAFISILCEHPSDPDGRDLILSHTLDEATEFRLAPVLTNKRVPAIKLGFWRWGEIFGFPEELTTDEEGAIMSEEMKVWLENNDCVLDPVAPQSGTRHIEFGAMNVQQQILRGAIHRVDDAAKEHELPLTGEEVVSFGFLIPVTAIRILALLREHSATFHEIPCTHRI